MKKISRASGFSLSELMIVVALLGGLSLVVMNITKQINKSSVKLQFDTDVTLTTNEINAILSDPVKCFTTFGSTATPTNIVGKYYIKTIPPGDKGYGNSGLILTSYTLTGTAPDGVLTILYQNKNILKGSSGAANISKKINLYIEGSPGAITKCRALSTSTTDLWTRGTATDANNVFYNGGVRAGDETQSLICDSSTEGTQRYNKATHSMQYCGYNAGPPVTYSWKVVGGGNLDCIVVSNTTAVAANGWQATCPADRHITGGGVILSVPGATGCFAAYVRTAGLGGAYMCADCSVRPSSCQAICCK